MYSSVVQIYCSPGLISQLGLRAIVMLTLGVVYCMHLSCFLLVLLVLSKSKGYMEKIYQVSLRSNILNLVSYNLDTLTVGLYP